MADAGCKERAPRPLRLFHPSQLRRRAGRPIRLNPLLGEPGYQPLTRGMQAALPHPDVFAPAHDLESLEALIRPLVI